jgi:hypothetical protein
MHHASICLIIAFITRIKLLSAHYLRMEEYIVHHKPFSHYILFPRFSRQFFLFCAIVGSVVDENYELWLYVLEKIFCKICFVTLAIHFRHWIDSIFTLKNAFGTNLFSSPAGTIVKRGPRLMSVYL